MKRYALTECPEEIRAPRGFAIGRRQFLLAMVPTLSAYAVVVEPQWLEVNRHVVGVRGFGGDEIRIAHLSDLHHSAFVPLWQLKKAVERTLEESPDIVCITGDFVTGSSYFDREFSAVLQTLSSRIPTYACPGNHDYVGGRATREFSLDACVRFCMESGITLLENQRTSVTVGRSSLSLVGVADLWNGTIDLGKAFGTTSHGPTILLAHNPDTKQLVRSHRWDLMLSGHTHGGQVCLPMLGAPFLPVEDRSMVSGLYHWEGRSIHISRGVGNLWGIRVNCRPEITVLSIRPIKDG